MAFHCTDCLLKFKGMCPRPYRLGQRGTAAARTRARILAAARELLAAGGPFAVDGVARQAGVARMTVYHQFGSRVGLLEALFDDLAARGGMAALPEAFRRSDPLDALAAFVATFTGFWASDQPTIRRLQALARIDAELGEAMRARNERRRTGLRVILGRLGAEPLDEAVDVLHMLTSFDTFDGLAGDARQPADAARLVGKLAHAALDLYASRPDR
jgi:AcrR family transcriptional regulator